MIIEWPVQKLRHLVDVVVSIALFLNIVGCLDIVFLIDSRSTYYRSKMARVGPCSDVRQVQAEASKQARASQQAKQSQAKLQPSVGYSVEFWKSHYFLLSSLSLSRHLNLFKPALPALPARATRAPKQARRRRRAGFFLGG